MPLPTPMPILAVVLRLSVVGGGDPTAAAGPAAELVLSDTEVKGDLGEDEAGKVVEVDKAGKVDKVDEEGVLLGGKDWDGWGVD